jgi:hypothetical protein
VDYHVAKVDEHPAGASLAFPPAVNVKLLVNRVHEALHLSGVVGRGNNEVVREAGNLADIE